MTSTEQEIFRQKSVVVIQAANQNLRDHITELLPTSGGHPHLLQFLVLTETGDQHFCRNLTQANQWGRAQNEAFAVYEMRYQKIVELSEAEVAVRVAAL